MVQGRVWMTLLLILGLGFALASVYQAGWSGMKEKMGLVDADFTKAVDMGSLQSRYRDVSQEMRCTIWGRIGSGLARLISFDEGRSARYFELGKDRIECGTGLLARQEVERGAYEILKGLGYLEQGYDLVYEQAEVNYRVCQGLPESGVFGTISTLLAVTQGKVHELIQQEYLEVETRRERVEPLCLEVRGGLR